MKINITSFIEKVNYARSASSEDSAEPMLTEADFEEQLTAAKQAITALSVDTVLSGDKDAAVQAAAVLSNSRHAELQAIGNVMSDYAGTSSDILNSKMEAAAADAVLKAAGYTPASALSEMAEKSSSKTTAQNNTSGIIADTNKNATSTESASTTTSTPKIPSTSNKVSSSSGTLKCSSELESYFAEAAETYNVDINLLKAIGMTESSFNPNATSSSGAMGVMQLMPFVAEELGISNAYDAHDNIMGGASVIASHLKRYDGNLELALAAYNTGAGTVKRHGITAAGQRYINKVLGFYKS